MHEKLCIEKGKNVIAVGGKLKENRFYASIYFFFGGDFKNAREQLEKYYELNKTPKSEIERYLGLLDNKIRGFVIVNKDYFLKLLEDLAEIEYETVSLEYADKKELQMCLRKPKRKINEFKEKYDNKIKECRISILNKSSLGKDEKDFICIFLLTAAPIANSAMRLLLLGDDTIR